MSEPDPILPYATAAPTRAHVWAATAVVFAGLALIGLGGCFLIGVASISTYTYMAPFSNPPVRAEFLLVILYILAAACFIAAAIVLYRGLRALFTLMRR